MTLVLAVSRKNAIWLMTDRRLSSRHGVVRDDATKMVYFEDNLDRCILGYSGVGMTALGVEPATWMASLLRGRRRSVDEAILEIQRGMQAQMPRHLNAFPHEMRTHEVVAPAIVGGSVRLYTVLLTRGRGANHYVSAANRRFVRSSKGHDVVPTFCVGGSGAQHLLRDQRWTEPLLRLLRAHSRGRVSDGAVADHLAKLNLRVHRQATDGTVGPRSIVAWRHRPTKSGPGGGGQRYYTGDVLDTDAPGLPTIVNGLDLQAISNVFTTHFLGALKAGGFEGVTKMDLGPMQKDVEALPTDPDENLM